MDIKIYSNGHILEPRIEEGTINAVRFGENGVRFITNTNGQSKVSIELSGFYIDDKFNRQDKTLNVTVNIYAYSLLSEFYLRNGSESASNNTVYYSTSETSSIDTSLSSITFNVVANHSESYAFYKYDLDGKVLKRLFEEGKEASTLRYNKISANEITKTLCYETYNNKFVYYYVQYAGNAINNLITNVTIKKIDVVHGTEEFKTFTLQIANAMAFYGYGEDEIEKNTIYREYDENDNVVAEYYISYTNLYKIRGESYHFNTENMTFTTQQGASSPIEYSIIANVEQSQLNKKFNAKISVKEFLSVDGISLASSASKLNFSNKTLHKVWVFMFIQHMQQTKKLSLILLSQATINIMI